MSPHERLGALSPFADNRLERLAFVPIPARAYLPRRPRYEGQASIRRYRWPNRRIVQEVRILAATRHLQLPSRSTGRGTDLDELLADAHTHVGCGYAVPPTAPDRKSVA